MNCFSLMSELLQAVWPAVSEIDWSNYCNKGVAPYDEVGVPKYTGLLMHYSGGGCSGASTVQVGFLPRPEKSAITAGKKVALLRDYPHIKSSMERRNPNTGYWGGGIRSSDDPGVNYAITMLPEIGDHLLIAQMMLSCNLLSNADWHLVVGPHTRHMTPALQYVDMSTESYYALQIRISRIVQDAIQRILVS